MDSHIGGGGEFAQIPYFPPYGDADDDDNVDYDKQLIHLDAWGAEKVLHIGHRHADLLMMMMSVMMCRNRVVFQMTTILHCPPLPHPSLVKIQIPVVSAIK